MAPAAVIPNGQGDGDDTGQNEQPNPLHELTSSFNSRRTKGGIGASDPNHYPGVAANLTYPAPFAANVPIEPGRAKSQVSGPKTASR